MIIELNSFFQMNLLEIPPGHPFCMVRQILLALLAVPGAAEYYEASTRDFRVYKKKLSNLLEMISETTPFCFSIRGMDG